MPERQNAGAWKLMKTLRVPAAPGADHIPSDARAAELPSSALDEADQDPAGGMATR
jgi:hypothetical protein